MKYNLKLHPLLLSHARLRVHLFNDSRYIREAELIAHVRSGDYFATLSTQLDVISESIRDTHEADSAILQALINDLMYVEQHFRLVKKG